MNMFPFGRMLLWVLSMAIGVCAYGKVESERESSGDHSTAYSAVIDELDAVVADELEFGILNGASIALIDGETVVLSKGYGWADVSARRRAASDTVYRVGSISKVFTALAAMQLVEQGKLQLDVPVQRYLPDFQIVNPFHDSAPITLRQLMCHRSGMVREAPVGSYFDDAEPSIDQCVASLESCVLVNPPNSKMRYSNIGTTIVGKAIAAVSGVSYEQYVTQNILEPLGMNDSAWRQEERVSGALATGYMRVADGKGGFSSHRAPQFELSTIPAGNLYSTADNMARFAKMLLAGGNCGDRDIISTDSLQEVSRPQLTKDETGFGLGFFVGKHRSHRTIQHTGAVYGFTASLVVVPDAKIAVVVLTNSDLVAGRVKRISEAALDLMLRAKFNESPREGPATVEIDTEQLEQFAGQFESSAYWAELEVADGQLAVNIAGQPMTARPIGPLKFEIDGRVVHRAPLEFKTDEAGKIVGFEAIGQQFVRVTSEPLTLPRQWERYLGSYGPEFIPLVVSVRHGHLYAMVENEFDCRLTPLTSTVFKMPEGLYVDEYLVFQLNEQGQVYEVNLANMRLKRLAR